MTRLLLGTQATTGKIHLATTKGDARCGMSRRTRYTLTTFHGTIALITCQRCKKIAQKQADKKPPSS